MRGGHATASTDLLSIVHNAVLTPPCAAPQNLLASIRQSQGKLQESHERSKVVTRGADMRTLRDAMQVGFRSGFRNTQHVLCVGGVCWLQSCSFRACSWLLTFADVPRGRRPQRRGSWALQVARVSAGHRDHGA